MLQITLGQLPAKLIRNLESNRKRSIYHAKIRSRHHDFKSHHLPASTPIVEAARRMRENDIGDVVVEKAGKLCRIVTDRDIVVRAMAQGKNVETTDLESICSKDITALSPDQTDEDAVRLMREKSIRRLPVVENGKVVGIVSLGDLAVDKDPRSVLGQVSAAAGNV